MSDEDDFTKSFKKTPKELQIYLNDPRKNKYKTKRSKLIGILLILLGTFFYYFDLVSDIVLIVDYYKSGEMLYFGLNLFFVLLPIVFILIVFLIFYKRLRKDYPSMTLARFAFIIILNLSQLIVIIM